MDTENEKQRKFNEMHYYAEQAYSVLQKALYGEDPMYDVGIAAEEALGFLGQILDD